MNNVILFDGICNLCNSSVQFIIKNDTENHFKFSSLQSEYGSIFLRNNGLNEKIFSTIILIEGDKYFTKSTAILKILTRLNGYKWVRFFLIIPRFLRDIMYQFISINRYKFFGKSKNLHCLIPSEKLSKKFL